MSLPCPKCGKHGFREVITKHPPAEDLVYPCCGQRRHFYYDDIHGWESQKEKQERVTQYIICTKCQKPFTIAHRLSDQGNHRQVCDDCFVLYWRAVGEKRTEANRVKKVGKKKIRKKWFSPL